MSRGPTARTSFIDGKKGRSVLLTLSMEHVYGKARYPKSLASCRIGQVAVEANRLPRNKMEDTIKDTINTTPMVTDAKNSFSSGKRLRFPPQWNGPPIRPVLRNLVLPGPFGAPTPQK